jgi:hypothetical protein
MFQVWKRVSALMRQERAPKVEVGLALAVVADARDQADRVEEGLVPRDLDRVRVDAPVIHVEAIVGVQGPVDVREAVAVAGEPGDLVPLVGARVSERRSGHEGLLVRIGQEPLGVLVGEGRLQHRAATQYVGEAREHGDALLVLALGPRRIQVRIRRRDLVDREADAAGEGGVVLVEVALAFDSAADRQVVVLDRDSGLRPRAPLVEVVVARQRDVGALLLDGGAGHHLERLAARSGHHVPGCGAAHGLVGDLDSGVEAVSDRRVEPELVDVDLVAAPRAPGRHLGGVDVVLGVVRVGVLGPHLRGRAFGEGVARDPGQGERARGEGAQHRAAAARPPSLPPSPTRAAPAPLDPGAHEAKAPSSVALSCTRSPHRPRHHLAATPPC